MKQRPDGDSRRAGGLVGDEMGLVISLPGADKPIQPVLPGEKFGPGLRFSQLFNQWDEIAILAAQVLAFAQRLNGRYHIEVDIVFHVSLLLVSGHTRNDTEF